jgi:hypothetical protein
LPNFQQRIGTRNEFLSFFLSCVLSFAESTTFV